MTCSSTTSSCDGYSLDDKREPEDANDLPDALEAWERYEAGEGDFSDRTERAFVVPAGEIRANRFDLSIGRYKEVPYEEEEYEPPQVILERMKELENDIQGDLTDLEGMLP